jgi:voltage-gated potassium channel
MRERRSSPTSPPRAAASSDQGEVTPHERGKPLSAVARGPGVRVCRDGKPRGLREPEARALIAGDTIVEILPTSKTEAELR